MKYLKFDGHFVHFYYVQWVLFVLIFVQNMEQMNLTTWCKNPKYYYNLTIAAFKTQKFTEKLMQI